MKVYRHDFDGNRSLIKFDAFTFSGGEEHVRFQAFTAEGTAKIEIYERLVNSSKVMALLLCVDALKRMVGPRIPIELVIPYFPYARQDRVCVAGEALGVKVMATVINSLGLSKVTTWDVHSDVSTALLNAVVNCQQDEILSKFEPLKNLLSKGMVTLVSPDAGATKKTLKLAQRFDLVPQIIQAQKQRDLRTGAIISTEISGDVRDKDVLIVDDICDGGRTFIELAKVLREQGAKTVSLFVTHGIFSKGMQVFDQLIDHVYTTDSIREASEFETTNNVNLTVIEM